MNKGRKVSGGKYHSNRKRKFYEKTRQENTVTLAERKTKKVRDRGGNRRTILLNANQANLITEDGIIKTEIKNVIGTPQNTFLARQNRLAKGAIIQTPLGKAKITNRPSREGSINAVLVKE